MLTRPQTTYIRGDMAESRWKLAVRRWLENQRSELASDDAPLMTVIVLSILEIKPASEENSPKSIARKPVEIASVSGTDANEKCDCHGSMSAMTDRDKIRLCEFCYKPFRFIRDHAKYCCETCGADAYLVRRAFGDGRAFAYIEELQS